MANFRIVFLLLMLTSQTANAQAFEAKSYFPNHTIYLHTDQESYFRGDTVWFKAYCIDSHAGQSDNQTKALFVDFVNPFSKEVLLSKKILLANNTGHGELVLPDTLRALSYQIRAYTNEMRANPADPIFQKNIIILNNQPPNTEAVSSVSDSIDIQFLPEGGHLVAELPNRVAFKAVNSGGGGTAISGVLIDGKGEVITAIHTEHLGMGTFYFTPKTGEEYRIKVESNPLETKNYKIPNAQTTGYTMLVNNFRKDEVWVTVNNNLPQDVNQRFTLMAHCKGNISFVGVEDADKKSIKFIIPRAKIGTGVVILTLLDNNQNALCERLIMGNLPEVVPVAIQTPIQKYGANEKVNLAVSLGDTHSVLDQKMQLSASIVDADQSFGQEDAFSLLAYNVLQPVLKGFIEKPDYYFDSQNRNAKLHLDLLLMTQGWRQFEWQQNPQGDSLAVQSNDFSVSGKVTLEGKQINKPLSLLTIFVLPDGTPKLSTTRTDEAGRFIWENAPQNDTVLVYAKPIDLRFGNKFRITIDSLPVPKIVTTQFPTPFFTDKKLLDNVVGNWITTKNNAARVLFQQSDKYLQEVVIKAKRPENDPRRIMYGSPDASLNFDAQNTAGANTVLDVINGRLAGVRVVNIGSSFSNNTESDDFTGTKVQIRGATDATGNPIEPLFLLDGVPVRKGVCSVIPASSVEAVDILKGAAASIYGTRAAGGVINILTKTGGTSDTQLQNLKENAQLIKLVGYATPKIFYSPRFGQTMPKNRSADRSRTLFWSSDVTINPSGTTPLSFFNSAVAKKLLIKIEGITSGGQLVSHAQYINLR